MNDTHYISIQVLLCVFLDATVQFNIYRQSVNTKYLYNRFFSLGQFLNFEKCKTFISF